MGRKEKIRRGTEREIANEKEMSGKERNAIGLRDADERSFAGRREKERW